MAPVNRGEADRSVFPWNGDGLLGHRRKLDYRTERIPRLEQFPGLQVVSVHTEPTRRDQLIALADASSPWTVFEIYDKGKVVTRVGIDEDEAFPFNDNQSPIGRTASGASPSRRPSSSPFSRSIATSPPGPRNNTRSPVISVGEK
ncbi:MAG: hypothetical protein ACRDWA_16895 [Acidimicrobiia bacterium]